MKKKRILRTAAALLAAVLLYPGNALAISAQKAILVDGQTGRVLYEKRADEKSLIASTTKIMTALLVCESCNVLDQVCIPREAVGIEGSSMYLQEGEVLSVQELLYGLMLQSGNDAATALAIYHSGSVEAFADRMNEKAQELGMDSTHFANPHGLDTAEHFSTARDLAVLAGNRYLTNHNKLLWQVEGADGVKTGFTKAAGRILVSSAKRSGRRLVCVTIDDGNDWLDHKTLFDDGFSRYHTEKIITCGQVLGTLQVFGGQEATVDVIAAEDFSFALATGEAVTTTLSNKGFVYAPAVANADAGFGYICVDGKPVGKVKVVFEKTVEQKIPEKKRFWDRIFGGKQ